MKRQGYTLIEMVVVMSMMMVIFAASIGAINFFMTIEGEGVQSLSLASTWFRLTRDFRNDVHSASEVTAIAAEEGESDGTLLQLRLPDDTEIVYRTVVNGIERVATRGDESLRTERYHLPSGSFAAEHDESIGLAQLVFRKEVRGAVSEAEAIPSEVWTVAAAVGRDGP